MTTHLYVDCLLFTKLFLDTLDTKTFSTLLHTHQTERKCLRPPNCGTETAEMMGLQQREINSDNNVNKYKNTKSFKKTENIPRKNVNKYDHCHKKTSRNSKNNYRSITLLHACNKPLK